jgi:hypothetical protein
VVTASIIVRYIPSEQSVYILAFKHQKETGFIGKYENETSAH